ncbi:MAG: hypothetical protein COA50_10325 [Flavobacteriaceae bacterium]|nr:MAG: hypothetical protein COA50_10325 [Flavobacteriaceae bacterium]
MKYKKILIQFLVIAALIGFIACSGYLFYISFHILVDGKLPENYLQQLNSAMIYVTSGLTGLVGGIVATGFGVEIPDDGVDASPVNLKLQNLGSFASRESDPDKTKEKIGFLYALSYIIVGIGAIIVWLILGDNTMQSVSIMATTFFGMSIPIVAQYF